ncbi:hypothetical protein BC833DRAFT_258692 [Globomyces pollinis-pini]|nr:hypothetical protein BC833DRAFT_258692 [Globomyces pollinis-pini]
MFLSPIPEFCLVRFFISLFIKNCAFISMSHDDLKFTFTNYNWRPYRSIMQWKIYLYPCLCFHSSVVNPRLRSVFIKQTLSLLLLKIK